MSFLGFMLPLICTLAIGAAVPVTKSEGEEILGNIEKLIEKLEEIFGKNGTAGENDADTGNETDDETEGETEGETEKETSDKKGDKTDSETSDETSGSHTPVVSAESQRLIVDTHNNFRREAAKSGPNGTATNMRKMYWDDEIAARAQAWVDKCIYRHDKRGNRAVDSLKDISIGQNMAKFTGKNGVQDWKLAIGAWYDEIYDFTYARSKNKRTGHFTQMTLAASNRVGCGFKQCKKDIGYYTCNYAISYSNADVSKPWNDGPKCGDCKDHCDDGLCDCRRTLCLNYGTFSLSSCSCKCAEAKLSTEESYFSGDSCENVHCPPEDHRVCARYQSFCKSRNFRYEYCPITCGLCPVS